MVKGDTTMLTLEAMKQCYPALAQTGKCQCIHANICSKSLKNMLHGTGIRYQNCIKNSPNLTLDENVTDSTEFEAHPVSKNENDEIAHREISKTLDTVTLEELPSKKIKVKYTVNGDTCKSLLNDAKSLSFLIEGDQEKLNCVFSVLRNLKEEIESDLLK